MPTQGLPPWLGRSIAPEIFLVSDKRKVLFRSQPSQGGMDIAWGKENPLRPAFDRLQPSCCSQAPQARGPDDAADDVLVEQF